MKVIFNTLHNLVNNLNIATGRPETMLNLGMAGVPYQPGHLSLNYSNSTYKLCENISNTGGEKILITAHTAREMEAALTVLLMAPYIYGR